MRKLLSRPLTHAVLALLLLFAQQQATLHWLSHAIESVAQARAKGAVPASDACGQCTALASLGAALTSTQAPAPVLGTADQASPEPAPSCHAPAFSPLYLSRAPPVAG